MSFGNSYGGGRTRSATRVYLNVYDLIPQAPPPEQQQPLQQQQQQQPGTRSSSSGAQEPQAIGSSSVLSSIGCGLHHTGVEIMGTEYSFSNNGIFTGTPKMVDPQHAVFKQQIEMGSYDGGSAELRQAIQELESGDNNDGGNFGPGQYNIIKRNCNHFSNALCWKLMRKTIPPHINRLADFGVCLSCLLPRQLLENAPVGNDGNGNGNANTNNATSSIQMQRGSTSSAKPAFTGTGQALGGETPSGNSRQQQNGLFSRVFTSSTAAASSTATTSSTAAASSAMDDPQERRERARKAALARLERQQHEDSKSQ